MEAFSFSLTSLPLTSHTQPYKSLATQRAQAVTEALKGRVAALCCLIYFCFVSTKTLSLKVRNGNSECPCGCGYCQNAVGFASSDGNTQHLGQKWVPDAAGKHFPGR